MNPGTANVIRGNARSLPLADNTVDLVVTSPPYFALRSYQDGGEHYKGQIGDEPTPAEFVDSLLEVTRECVRVLKPSGSLWVNLGDKYAGGGGQWDKDERPDPHKRRAVSGKIGSGGNTYGLRAKSLIGIPWRYALACIDDLGLILRAEVIWSKPNGLPESVTDRVRRSHEQWFHMTLSPRYFSAVDELREQSSTAAHHERYAGRYGREDGRNGQSNICGVNPLGKLPGSVWTVPTEPLKVPAHLGVDHFAAFPTEWPKRIIQGWSPSGVCVECGEGRRPVADRQRRILTGNFGSDNAGHGQDGRSGQRAESDVTITGYACACINVEGTGMACGMPFQNPTHADHPFGAGRYCPGAYGTAPPTTPAVVLDPFGGTGTTAMVAKALGRHGISVDMSADYCRLGQWRTQDRNQLAKVVGIDKADPVHPDQLDLFGEPA